MMRSFGLIASFGVLMSCAAPGTPGLLPAGSNGSVPFCQTISSDTPRTAFVQEFYLTTWGSAYREGAAAGVRDGLNDGSALGAVVLGQLRAPSKYKGQDIFAIRYDADPFCMAFSAPFAKVDAATSRAFSELRRIGFRTTRNGGEVPSYETTFKEGAHRSADWLERFVAAVERLPDGRTVVVLSRGIYIKRDDSGYYQGNSVGQNEAAILTRIRDIVEQ